MEPENHPVFQGNLICNSIIFEVKAVSFFPGCTGYPPEVFHSKTPEKKKWLEVGRLLSFWDGTCSGAMFVKLPGCSWNMLKIHLCSVQLLSHTLEQCSLQAFQSLVNTGRIGRETTRGWSTQNALESWNNIFKLQFWYITQNVSSCILYSLYIISQYGRFSIYQLQYRDQPTTFGSESCASFSSPGWCAKARFRQQSNRKRRSQTSSP